MESEAPEDANLKPLRVPEILLKKRKRDEETRLVRVAGKAAKRAASDKRDSNLRFKRAETFVEEYRAKEADLIRLKHEAEQLSTGNLVLSDAKLVFAIRVGGIPPKLHKMTKKILRKVRLEELYTGVFLKADEPNMQLLQLLGPHIAFGYPSLKSVKDLVFKRGFGQGNEGKLPLTNNDLIEEVLGDVNIICMEDLIHEIYSVGTNFNRCARFLWPFVMNRPVYTGVEGKLRQKKRAHTGNMKKKINELIKTML